ncbi:MAG: hypothetical protein A3E80_05430 [Chlamydiae bacterium RIFCSPHIGHO2_12_FULL_49_9]|nr:MAG: hypothetical protein A3E80_05430 [Chlamydiae bacterium RIFCSPHIGHO2_12_FULL_49_9]
MSIPTVRFDYFSHEVNQLEAAKKIFAEADTTVLKVASFALVLFAAIFEGFKNTLLFVFNGVLFTANQIHFAIYGDASPSSSGKAKNRWSADLLEEGEGIEEEDSVEEPPPAKDSVQVSEERYNPYALSSDDDDQPGASPVSQSPSSIPGAGLGRD